MGFGKKVSLILDDVITNKNNNFCMSPATEQEIIETAIKSACPLDCLLQLTVTAIAGEGGQQITFRRSSSHSKVAKINNRKHQSTVNQIDTFTT